MIVVDASALLEALLRTPAAAPIEARLFDPRETLHAPHLIDVEVAQVLRRYASAGEISAERGRQALDDLTAFRIRAIRTNSCCRASGSCAATSPPTTRFMSPLPRRWTRRSSRATAGFPGPQATGPGSSLFERPESRQPHYAALLARKPSISAMKAATDRPIVSG